MRLADFVDLVFKSIVNVLSNNPHLIENRDRVDLSCNLDPAAGLVQQRQTGGVSNEKAMEFPRESGVNPRESSSSPDLPKRFICWHNRRRLQQNNAEPPSLPVLMRCSYQEPQSQIRRDMSG